MVFSVFSYYWTTRTSHHRFKACRAHSLTLRARRVHPVRLRDCLPFPLTLTPSPTATTSLPSKPVSLAPSTSPDSAPRRSLGARSSGRRPTRWARSLSGRSLSRCSTSSARGCKSCNSTRAGRGTRSEPLSRAVHSAASGAWQAWPSTSTVTLCGSIFFLRQVDFELTRRNPLRIEIALYGARHCEGPLADSVLIHPAKTNRQTLCSSREGHLEPVQGPRNRRARQRLAHQQHLDVRLVRRRRALLRVRVHLPQGSEPILRRGQRQHQGRHHGLRECRLSPARKVRPR